MNRKQFFNTLHLDDQAFFHNEIDPIRRGELDTVVNDRQMHLVVDMQASRSELVKQARADGALEHSSAQCGMHAKRAVVHFPGGTLEVELRGTRAHLTGPAVEICRGELADDFLLD